MAIVAAWPGNEQQKTPVCTAIGGIPSFTFSAKRFVCHCGYGSLVGKKSRLFVYYHSISHRFEMAGPVHLFFGCGSHLIGVVSCVGGKKTNRWPLERIIMAQDDPLQVFKTPEICTHIPNKRSKSKGAVSNDG